MSAKEEHEGRNHAAEGELVGGVAERVCAVARHVFEGNWNVFAAFFDLVIMLPIARRCQ